MEKIRWGIIGCGDVDAVCIATRPDSHYEYVRRVAAAGKPVYVEKPMGLDFATGKREELPGRRQEARPRNR